MKEIERGRREVVKDERKLKRETERDKVGGDKQGRNEKRD